MESSLPNDPKLIAILVCTVLFLAAVINFLFMRSQSQHREMLKKIREAHEKRPEGAHDIYYLMPKYLNPLIFFLLLLALFTAVVLLG